MHEPHGGVVFVADGWSLLVADDAELSRLGPAVTALEAWDSRTAYVYALCAGAQVREAAAACGRVLTEDAAGLVLATDPEGIYELNCLPVQLCMRKKKPRTGARQCRSLLCGAIEQCSSYPGSIAGEFSQPSLCHRRQAPRRQAPGMVRI